MGRRALSLCDGAGAWVLRLMNNDEVCWGTRMDLNRFDATSSTRYTATVLYARDAAAAAAAGVRLYTRLWLRRCPCDHTQGAQSSSTKVV